MIPAAFEYRRVGSVAEAIAALSADEDAKLLAGGHSLLPLMKLRLAVPSLLIDLGGVPSLSYVRDGGDHLAIGALTRHCDVERSDLVRRSAPLLAYVAGQVGDPQVRHRGTIGGSIAHGDPASDLPAAVLALEATLVVEGPDGERTIPAGELFLGFLETSLRPGEVLTEIRVPRSPGGWSFQKFNRRAQDWAIVGAVIATAPSGRPNVALVNMAATPVRAAATESALAAGAGTEEAARLAADGLEPPSDLNASPEYRRHLASVLVRRGLEEAAARDGAA